MRKLYTLVLAMLFISVIAKAQIPVTVTNATNTTPNLSAIYPNLAAALTDINAVTAMSGPITLTLYTGTETAPATGLTLGSASLNAVLSATNTITIVKGAGQTPVLSAGVGTATPTSAAPDGILKLSGADYVTIDGLTLTDGNVANPATMEYGLGLFKLSTSDGCNNNIIQNCVFNMQRINNASSTAPMIEGSVGILVINATAAAATTALTPASAAGANSNNKFYSNTINGGNYGIGLSGFAATSGVGPAPTPSTFLGDLNNDIGGVGAPAATTGNTILNYGGGASTNPAAGIRANNQWGLNIANNIINNNNGSGVNHATTLRGIFAQAGTSGNVTISYNTVTVRSGATTSALTAIDNGIGSTASGNTVTITYNTVQNCTYAAGTTATYSCISNSATAAIVNITNNIVQNNTFTGAVTTGTFNGVVNSAANTTTNLNNNQVLNNTIGTNGTASACNFFGVYCSGSSTNFNANNNTISGNILANSYGNVYCIRGVTSTVTVDGNTITNNTIPNSTGATSSVLYGYYNVSSPAIENVTNNIINNLSITGASTATSHVISGIYNVTAAGAKTFSGNKIDNLNFTSSSTGYAFVTGIRNPYTSTSNIFKNVIHTLSSTGTTPTVAGLYLGSTTVTTINAYNNIIGNLFTPQSTGHNLYGIYAGSAGTNINIYYNTVYLNATSTGTNFASSAVFFSSTTPTTTIRNNIFVNLSTPTGTGLSAALRRSATALTSYGSASNNNVFYAGTPAANKLIYYDGTNSDQTMAAFKARVSSRESASFSESVSFLSVTGSDPTFLHIDPAVATQIESGGTAIPGITDDIDGNVRNVTTPDIGADEGTFTLLDIVGPGITYTALANTLCTSDRAFSAAITDASSVNTTAGTAPRLYFKRLTDLNEYNDNTSATNGWKYVEASNTSSPFNFTINYSLLNGGSGINAGQGIQYFVVAQDLNGTPNVSINSGTFAVAPTSVALTGAAFPIGGTINSYNVLAGLSADVTIGAAGTYTSITGTGGLFEAINNSGLTTSITARILDASVTETGAVALNQIAYGCATSILTIKPNTGVDAVLTGSVATGAIIKLNGADNVIIDGSNNGTTSRNLTIRNTTTTTSGNAVVWLASPASGNGATNNIIKNSIIEGNAATTTFLGMYIGGSTAISLTSAGSEQNNSNTVQNNLFRKAQYGIALFGYSASVPDNGNIITGNNFGTSVTGEGFNIEAIHADRQTALVVSGNEVQNVKGTSTTNMYGIRLLDFKSGQLYNNIVHDISYTGTSTTKNYGIAVQSSSYTTVGNPSQSSIYNNVVYAINSTGTSAVWNATGILASQGYGDKYYYNSVSMGGQINNSSSGLSAAFAIGDDNITSGGTNLDVRNNIIDLSGSSLGGNVWAFYTRLTSYSGFTQNNNIIRCSGTGATNNFGRFNSTNYTTLAAWQAATGVDANSISADPMFNSATNLIPQLGSPAVGAGTPIVGITTDLLGTARNATTPTIGAYENALDAIGPNITYTAVGNVCTTGDRTITNVTIADASGVPTAGGTIPRIYYKKGVGGTWSSNAGILSSGSATNGVWSFTIPVSDPAIGSLNIGDQVFYYIIAQDIAAIPNISSNPSAGLVASNVNTVTTPPTTPNSYTISSTISGTKTIGASGADYTSVTAAVTALNTSCLTGPVVLSLIDASYSAGETFPITLNNVSGASSTNTITLKPATGVTATISGSSASGILASASPYFIIDGSNSNGGTSRDLTINNTSTAANTYVIGLFNFGGAAVAQNDTIRNTIITGGATSNANAIYGVILNASGGDFDNVAISNNLITKVKFGIQFAGVSGSTSDNGKITGNTIGSTTDASSCFSQGIIVSFANNLNIEGNEIIGQVLGNTGNSTTSFSSANINAGIVLINSSTNTRIRRNKIHDFFYNGTGGYGAFGITYAPGATTNTGTTEISNNFIYNIKGDCDVEASTNPGYLTQGISIVSNGTAAVQIYNNTISLTGNVLGTGSFLGSSACIGINGTVGAGSMDIRNNILRNAQMPNTGVANPADNQTMGIWVYGTGNANIFSALNYNAYSLDGNAGRPGYLNALAADIAAWQTATSKEANSFVAVPAFVSASDLHLEADVNCAFDAVGESLLGVDIDNDARTGTTDIGADQFTNTFNLTITNPAAVCTGSTVDITAAGVTAGSTSGGTLSYWTDNLATNTLAAPAAVATGGTYYIKLVKGSCTSIKAVTATIDPLSVGGTASSDQTICSGTAPANISLTGQTGSVVKWQKSSDLAFTSPIDIAVTTTTLNGATEIGNLTPTTYLRAVVKSGACSESNSSVVTIIVNSVSVGGTASANQAICSGAIPANITLSGNTGNVVKWQRSTASDFSAGLTDINVTSTTLNGATDIGPITVGSNTIFYFRAVVKSGVCNDAFSTAAAVTVNAPTVAGTASANQAICTGSTPANLTLSGNTGSVVKWQKASDIAFTTPVDIPASASTTLTGASIGALSATTYFRAVVQNGACGADNSTVVTVTVDPVSVGGTASADQAICSGSTPANLTLAGNTGSVVKWQRSSDLAFTAPVDIANTTTTLTGASIGALSATTYFRAVVQSGVCSQANSSVVTITVSPVSVGGTVSSNQTICSGSTPANITLSGNTGSVVKWQKISSAPFSTPVDIANTTTTLTGAEMGALTETTFFRAVVQSGPCSQTFSSAVTITVSAATVAGTVSGAQTICIGNAPLSDLTLSGNTGAVVKWQKASDLAFTTPTDIASTSATLTSVVIGAVNANTYFRAVVQSGGCAAANTPGVLIGVNTTVNNSTPLAGTVGGGSVCSNYDVATSNDYLNNCSLIATVAPAGASPVSGNVNSCVKIDGSVQIAPTGEPYVQRHFDILPASNATTATSTITLYFKQSEFDAFNLAKGFYAALPTSASDAAGIANLRVTQYNGTGTAPGNYTGSATQINPADANIVYNATAARWSVTFSVTGSGGFYVHTGKFVLPVTLLNFKGEMVGEINKLTWLTATETNNLGFEVERSADGKNFSSLGFVATKADNGNSNITLNYSFDDAKPMQGNNYYRLKQVDKNGKVNYSNTIVLSRKVKDIIITSVYPNPTTRELNLVVTSPKAEKVTLIITDLSGKVLRQLPMQLMIGDNIQKIDVFRFAAGTYFIKAICDNGCETTVQRFVKQ